MAFASLPTIARLRVDLDVGALEVLDRARRLDGFLAVAIAPERPDRGSREQHEQRRVAHWPPSASAAAAASRGRLDARRSAIVDRREREARLHHVRVQPVALRLQLLDGDALQKLLLAAAARACAVLCSPSTRGRKPSMRAVRAANFSGQSSRALETW